MLIAFVYTLISLHPFFNRSPVAAPAPDHESSPWFMGCADASSSRLHAPKGARDLDPATCSVRCLDEGYQVAALTSEACYCGNRQHGLVAGECFNTSSDAGTKDVRGGRQSVLHLPVGGGQGSVALYRTEGPFLHSLRLSTSPDRVQAGKTFVVEVSGKLAGRPDQPTGILGLGGQDLSYVTVELQESTSKGQSSHRVSVLDDGSFAVSSDWILETSGKYELNVRVSHPLSTLSSTLHLSVLQPSAHGLVVSVLHGPLGGPSCVPVPQAESSSVAVEAAYLGHPVTLQAYVGGGLPGEVFWRFTSEEKEKNMKSVKSDCLSSTVDWTFETAGVHVVSVNASRASGWKQETINVPVQDTTPRAELCRFLGNVTPTRVNGAFVGDYFQLRINTHLVVVPLRVSVSRNQPTVLPRALTVYEHLCAPRPSGSWKSAFSAHAGFGPEVVGAAGTLGSRVIWTFMLGNVTVMSRTTEEWNVNVSLATAGCYTVTVQASFCTHILLQDPAGESVLKVPGSITTKGKVLFSVSAGSNVTVSLLVNATLLYRSSSYATGEEAAAVLFSDHTGTLVVELRAENQASSQNKSVRVCVEGNRKPSPPVRANLTWQPPTSQSPAHNPADNVQIYAAKQAYPTHTDITFLAVADVPDPVELLWHFGDGRSDRSASRTVTKRYHTPGRYDVVVVMSSGRTSVTSDVFPLVVQRAVKLNRLLHQAAVLQNQTLAVSCRVNVGTDVTFLWSFGDGPARPGQSTEQHVFHRTGEFSVEVTVSNLVSSASLRGLVFVVDRPCQPPPVKNMGPVKLQVRRHEVVRLGVTYEAEVDCDISGGLHYSWALFDSAGRVFPLPLVDARRQTLVLPGHLLHYDTYTAIARVQVVGSVVYSNYSVRVEVIPSPPVAFIQGGTNIFINDSNTTVVTLDGRKSYDPDFPMNTVSFSWTCKPVSSITSSCFHHDVPTSSPVFVFPASFLKHNFDQFQFTLTVRSGERSAASETFLTSTSNMIGKMSVHCPQCQGDQLNWDQSFSVSALCEGCDASPKYTQYTWSLYLVSASSKPATEVPFCHTVDLSAPSTIMEGPAPSTIMEGPAPAPSTIMEGPAPAPSPITEGPAPSTIMEGPPPSTIMEGPAPSTITEGPAPAPSTIMEGPAPSTITEDPAPSTITEGPAPAPSTITEDPAPSTITEDPAPAPSTITEGPAPSPQPPGTSSLRSPAASHYLSNNKRKKSSLAEPEPSPVSSLLNIRTAGSGEESFYHPLGEFDPPKPLYSSTEYPPLDNSGILYSDHFGQSDVISEFPVDSDSSADWEFSFPVPESVDVGGRLDYDVPVMSAEEGDPGVSAGRPSGVEGESLSPGDESAFHPALHEDQGSNLVDSRPSVVIREPIVLDLPRDPVDGALFESYTYTGLSAPLLRVRPFSLTPGSRYMLEVTAKSQNSLLGRTQLFLKTNPAPGGVTCQVQPVDGAELHTHFSVFCTSGKEDLLYEYSVRVGDRSPRTLYQGRDFQYYFSLPSGDPNDQYKVTIYTEIRSGTYGTATKPCPVTVRVQPSFFRDASSSSSSSSSHLDPDLELSESGLRNLSALVRLGNNVEIRNYVSLLCSILNRLSLDTEANTHAQTRTRNVLISTVCELESSGQASMVDNICILKNLLEVTSQVTLASVRRVTVHVQVVSEQISESSAPARYFLEQKTLNSLVALLSHSLHAAGNDFTPEMSTSADITRTLESDPHDEIQDASSGVYTKRGGSMPTKQAVQLVAGILQTASDLMLKYILIHKVQEHRVSTGLIALYATYQNQTSTIISSGSTTFHLPASLIQRLLVHGSRKTENRPRRPCVLNVLTELSRSPHAWAHYPTKLSGPVVDLSLYKCSTRRKIPVRSLIQPIDIELQQPSRNKSFVPEHVLLRSQVNYHSFNITQEHLQQAIQLSVVFTPPLNKPFPIMLLFRMFERPTPSMHHLHRIHSWRSDITRFTLPSSYLRAAGVGHVALLNADFGKRPRHKRPSEQVSYSLTVDSSLCLSWDGHQGAWTHRGCRTQQTDTTTAVCSCHQLRPLTVVQQQIQSSHDRTGLDAFLSVSRDLTVPGVLVLCVCLYLSGVVVCKRADVTSERHRRVHYLPDNSPCDPHLYAVTVHTGLCSAACMSAKVYMVLNGEDGFSQTMELQVPGCTLFRRHSQDTFIFSAADSLGPVWGLHIWHDNSGPSPNWYLKQVEVSEVSRGHVKGRVWLFVGQCWLAVDKSDGRVERRLRVCTRGLGFTKMLFLKLSDYLADYHIWISLFSCPCPNAFTHTQRLSVILLLLLGYTCVNTVLISQLDEQLPLELGIIDASAVSVTTGVLSVFAVLPAAAIISFLFRLREVKLTGSGVQQKGRKTEKSSFEEALSVNGSVSEPHLSWSGLQHWAQEAWRKNYQDTDLPSVSTTILENKSADKEPVITTPNVSLINERHNVDQAPQGKEFDLLSGGGRALLSGTRDGGRAIQEQKDPRGKCSSGCSFEEDVQPTARGFRASPWCHALAWTLCLLVSLCCLVLSATLGMRFSSSQVLLWIHSLSFSLMSCIFLIQPAVITAVAVSVSFWYRNRSDFHSFSGIREFEKETSKLQSHNAAKQEPFGTCALPQGGGLEKLLGARQRARYLRLVRPPTPAELRKTRRKKRRESLIHNTLRDVSVCGSMLSLMLCISYGSSFSDHYHLNDAVRKQFVRGRDDTFMSIQKHEDWWKWAQSNLLHLLYKNASATTEQSHILVGEPVLKTEVSSVTHGSGTWTRPLTKDSLPLKTFGPLDCYLGQSATVGLGHTKSAAASKLTSAGWLCGQTVSVHFTLFSPAPNLFTSVTMLAEQSPSGVLLPSAKVQSVRLYHTPAVWDYAVMVCQLLFLLLSLLQLCDQVHAVGQQGLMGYWRTPCSWLEVSLLTVTLVYYVYYIYHSVIILEVAELLQRHNYRGHVDVSLLATWEQCIRSLRGVTLFLLTMKSVTVLRVNRTLCASAALLTRSLSRLFWPTMSGLILMVALSCTGNLLFAQSSSSFSSLSRSLQTLLCHRRALRPVRGLLFSGRDFLYRGVLSLSSVLWTAVVVGVMSSLVRSAKRSQSSRNVFTIAELAGYVRRRVSEFTGQRRRAWTESHVEGKTYYFEEFESLLDEVLFRLNALSNTVPPEAHRCREEDSPVISPTQEPNMDALDSVRTQTKGQSYLSVPESPPLIRVWTEVALEKQVDQWTKTKDKTQATQHIEVEVLVHEEPGSVEPHKQ